MMTFFAQDTHRTIKSLVKTRTDAEETCRLFEVRNEYSRWMFGGQCVQANERRIYMHTYVIPPGTQKSGFT